MKRLGTILLLIGIVATNLCAQSQPTFHLLADRTEVYLGENVLLRAELRSDVATDAPLELNIPTELATVQSLGQETSSSSTITIINGRRECTENRTTIYTYRLHPKVAGSLTIPSLQLTLGGKNLSTEEVTIRVKEPDDQQIVRLNLSAIPPNPLPGEPFTVRLEVAVAALTNHPNVEPLLPLKYRKSAWLSIPYLDEAFRLESLDTPPQRQILSNLLGERSAETPCFHINSFSQSLNDFIFAERTLIPFRLPTTSSNGWWFYTLDYPCRAQKNGRYDFGPIIFRGQVQTNYLPHTAPQTTQIYAVAPSITVPVALPPRNELPNEFIGAVGTNLQATARLDGFRTRVGELLTLTIELNGAILPEAIQSPILTQEVEGFKLTPEPIKTETLQAGRRFQYRLRPQKEGTLEFPALPFAYWEASTRTVQTVRTLPMPVQVLPALPTPFGDETIVATPLQPAGLYLGELPTPLPPLITRRAITLFLVGPLAFLLYFLLAWLAHHLPNGYRQFQAYSIKQKALRSLAHPSKDTLPALRRWLGNSLTPSELATQLKQHGITIDTNLLESLEPNYSIDSSTTGDPNES